MVILLAAMLALPGKPGHALLELEKDVDRAEAILASGHGSLERAAQLETGRQRCEYQTVSSAHAKHLAHIAYDIYRVPDGDFAEPGLVASIKASLGAAMMNCYRTLFAAAAGVVGVPDPPGVGSLGTPLSNAPSDLSKISGTGIPTAQDWMTYASKEETFTSQLTALETNQVEGGTDAIAHDAEHRVDDGFDVFWAAEGGLTEEDDEVFSDLDYDGGA